MHSENTAAVVDGNVHPCFLYESLLCLLGFVLLHFFTRRFRRYDGQTFLLYIVWYGACRFFIEGLRTDSLIICTGLRVSQVIAAACVVAGIILLVLFRHRTSLTGCGDRRVMEAVGLVESTALPEDETPSTIFGDLPPEEIQEIFHGHPAWEKGEQAVQKAEEEEAKDPEPAAGDPAGAEAERKRKRRSNFAGSCNWKGADEHGAAHRRKGGLRKGAGRGGPRGGRLGRNRGVTPGLAVVIVGDDPASRIYVNNKKKACQPLASIRKSMPCPLPLHRRSCWLSGQLNHKRISMASWFSPLAQGLDEGAVVEAIDPQKDVDAFHAYNVGKIMIGDYHFLPCTLPGLWSC